MYKLHPVGRGMSASIASTGCFQSTFPLRVSLLHPCAVAEVRFLRVTVSKGRNGELVGSVWQLQNLLGVHLV